MQQRFDSLPALLNHGFDSIIDVRSPAEFAIDHIPGALNMPVLDDDQRAKVGTIYVQQSAFLARKIGGAMVYRNAAAHIETHLMDTPGGWRPLVYCWRGGQRSGHGSGRSAVPRVSGAPTDQDMYSRTASASSIVTFFASPKIIIVLSLKKSGF